MTRSRSRPFHAAVECGVNLIDTATGPMDFGRSEENRRAVRFCRRGNCVRALSFATKNRARVEGRESPSGIAQSQPDTAREITDSLRRLRTDYIDIYSGPLGPTRWLCRSKRTAEGDARRCSTQGKIPRDSASAIFSVGPESTAFPFLRVAKLARRPARPIICFEA